MKSEKKNKEKKIKESKTNVAVMGKTYWGYLYILPVFVFLGIFTYYAMGFNIQISFFKWNGVSSNKVFVGLDNYKNLFMDRYFIIALKNTFKYFMITIPVQAIIGFTIAYIIQHKVFLGKFARSLIFLPNIMALVVIAYVFSQMYNYQFGFLNELLRSINLDALAKDWTGNPKYALNAVIVVNIYTYVGFSMTLYIAGLTSIGRDVLEAATIDGANNLQKIRYIDLPLLLSTHITIVILGIVGTLKTFDIVWLITRGGPSRTSEMLATLLYRSYILEYKAGYAAAVAVIVLIIALTLSIVNLYIQRKNTI